MEQISAAISCNLDENLLATALALFEEEKVEAIEWSFDTLFKISNIPGWFTDLLHAFSAENRLVGHGVYFSLFSGGWSKEQEDWLTNLKKLSDTFRFDHITEHFGFMTGENFHHGAPLPIPYTATTLAIGRDRLKRIQQHCQCPVGLENLAFSYSTDEVKKHGEFLERLVEPVNGFIILDLHNLYCQSHNFNMPADELLKLYPLERVREIHVSGGSWEDSISNTGKKIRRDTHDDSVPDEVFKLLAATIPQCRQLKFVVLEQLSSGLKLEEQRAAFRRDFEQMSSIIKQQLPITPHIHNNFLPQTFSLPSAPLTDSVLQQQQAVLSNILETAPSYYEAVKMLQTSILANAEWQVEYWEPYMLETAINIAQKWKSGFN